MRSIDGALDDTIPAARAITVRDLLSFRMGFGLVWGKQDALPIQRAAHALHLGAFGPPHPQAPPPPDEWIRRFATLPLMHQPGERWMYTTGAEILGVLLARADDAPLDVLLRRRILDPLGMKDTGFFVPPASIARLPECSFVDPSTGKLVLYDRAADGEWSKPPAFPSAAGGLVSTVDDLVAFSRMMIGGGAIGSTRVVSAASIAEMTRDQITDAQKSLSTRSLDENFWKTYGWGLGIATTHDGGFGWDGGLGTSWRAFPARAHAREGFAILLTQRSEYPAFSPTYRTFWDSEAVASMRSARAPLASL
jgi:CubicO group peptidase (beta-lactamase class C family)